MDLTGIAARSLARRSSRRQFFKLLGAGSLGAGLFLTRTGVSLGAVESCVGCGGGPCNPAGLRLALCEQHRLRLQDVPAGRRLPGWLHHLRRVVLLLAVERRRRCRLRCSECNCGPNHSCNDPACHCFTNLASPARLDCTPATSRARARRTSPRSRACRTRWTSPASPRTLSPSGRHAGSSSRCSERPRSGAGLFLTRTGVSLGAVEGCVGCGGGPCNPCGSPRHDLREHRLLVQDLPAGRRLPRGLHDHGRVVLLPDERPGRLPLPLLRVRVRRVRKRLVPLLHQSPDPLHASAALR